MEWQQQQHWRDQVPSASQALVPVGAATVAQDQTNSCPASFEFGREEDAARAAAAAAAAEAAAAAAEEAAAAEAAEAEAAEAAVVGTAGISLSALALFPYDPATAVAAAQAAAAAGSNGGEKGDSAAEELPVAAPAAGAQQRQQQRILLALPDDYTAASAVPLTCDHHHHHNTRSPFSTSPVPGAAMPTTQPAAAAAGAAASRPIRSPGFAAPAPAAAAFGTGAAFVEEGCFGNSGGRSLFGEPQEQPLLSSTAAESALRNEYQVVLYKNRHIVLYNPHTYRAGARCLSAAEERAINEHRLAQCPLCGQAVDSHQFSFEARTYFQILQQLFRRLRRQQRRCAAPAAGASAAHFAPPASFSSATEETAAALSQNGDGDSSPDPAARVVFPSSRETARRAAAAGAPPPLPFSAAAAALPPVFPQQQQQTSGSTAVAGPGAAAAGIPPSPPLSAERASRGGGAAAEFFTRVTGSSQGGWGAAAAPGTTAAPQPRSPQQTTAAGAGLAASDQSASRAILEHQQQGWQQQKSDCTPLQASAALLNEAFEFGNSSNSSSSNAPKDVQRTEAPAASAASAGRAWQSKDNSRLLFSSAQSATAAAAAVGGGGGGNGPVHAAATSGNAAADCIPSTRNIPVELLVTGYYRRFFVEREKLGSGSYGQVYLCTHILDELTLGEYAVKKLPVGDDKHWLQKMLQEVKIREKLHHPNIVDYKHSWLEMHRSNHMCPWVPWLFVLMEYCNGGSLEALIWDRGVDAPPSRYLTDDQIWLLLLDVLLGLQHLHQSAILYRDMKPSNVLLQHLQQRLTGQLQCRALLADFGTAELLGEQQRSREAGEEDREKAGKAGCAGGAEAADAAAAVGGGSRHRGYTGTIEFTAPEVLQTDRYGLYGAECDTKSDMWSLGIILYAMCYARLPYLDKEPSACRRLILAHQSLQLPEHPPRHPTLKLLIQALTSKDPALRPSTDEVLEDPRVREVMNDRPRLERAGEELALLLQQRRPSKTPRSMHQHNRHASAGTSPGRAARARRGDSNSRGRCIPRRSFVASLPPIHPSVATDERENESGFPPAESAVALTARGPKFKAINLSLF